MGQKIHPRGLRLGIIQGWDSNWLGIKGNEYAQFVLEDYKIRNCLRSKLKHASLSRVEIDRKAQKLLIRIVTGRSGVVVGRGGQGIDSLRQELKKLTGRKEIQIDVLEVGRVDADPQLISESIAQQLEKRVAYRRAIKQAIQRANRSGVKGIKIMVAGRLGGAEIARTEWVKEGRIPLHTFRANVEYGFTEAKTVFGIIGVKVWIFHGEVLPGEKAQPNINTRTSGEAREDGGMQAPGGRGRRGPGGGRPGGSGGPGGGRRGAGGRAGKVTVIKQGAEPAATSEATPPEKKD